MQNSDYKHFPFQDKLGYIELRKKSIDPLLDVVNAARVSYNKQKKETDDSDTRLCRFLWEHSHTSVFRHCHYSFALKLPIFVARQWLKYQVGSDWMQFTDSQGNDVDIDVVGLEFDTDKGCSWNEVSGRYVQLEPEYYLPDRMRSNAGHANKQMSSELIGWTEEDHASARIAMQKAMSSAFQAYKAQLDLGVARELARIILPMATYTTVIWTVSLQGLLHFLAQRLKPDAQWELRQYALGIKGLVAEDLEDLGIQTDAGGVWTTNQKLSEVVY